MGVSKIRLLPRHSGESIMRYVADAPLKSLRADLGLPSSSSSSSSSSAAFAAAPASKAADGLAAARLRKLEAAMVQLQSDVQGAARDMVGLAAGYLIPEPRVFVQNTATSAVHLAKPNDNRHSLCG